MNRFRHILYLSEPSVAQTGALKQALLFAQRHNSRLTLLEVMPEVSVQFNPLPRNLDLKKLESSVLAKRREELQSMVDELQPNTEVTISIKMGKRFVEAIRTVLADRCDLLIKAAENPPWIQRLFGGDDMHLLRKCPCPLWIIKEGGKTDYQSILLPMDFDASEPDSALSPMNELLLKFSADMASDPASRLHILHCWQAPDSMMLKAWGSMNDKQVNQYVQEEKIAHQKSLQRIADYINPRLGVTKQGRRYAHFHLLEGAPQTIIPTQVRDVGADLLVMGSVARSGISGVFIGNTAEMVLEQVDCSVLVIKLSDFVSPVKLDDES